MLGWCKKLPPLQKFPQLRKSFLLIITTKAALLFHLRYQTMSCDNKEVFQKNEVIRTNALHYVYRRKGETGWNTFRVYLSSSQYL